MRFNNPRRNANGTIDVELEHPQLGLIPFTAAPYDPEPMGRALHAEILAAEKAGLVTIPDRSPVEMPEPVDWRATVLQLIARTDHLAERIEQVARGRNGGANAG